MQAWMIGVVSGAVAGGYWPALPPAWAALPVLTLAVLTAWSRNPARRFTCGVSCGCLLALVHGTHLLQHRLTEACVGVPLTVTGVVASLPTVHPMPRGEQRQRFTFAVRRFAPKRCAGPRTLMLAYYGDEIIAPGETWQFMVSLKKPWGQANPGAFNMQAWFAQQGIDAVGTVRAPVMARRLPVAPGILSLPDRQRQALGRRIDAVQSDRDIAAILRAVTVADGSGIGPRLWFLFQQYGLNHLLVVSGLHIVMMAAIGLWFGAACRQLLAPLGFHGDWIPGICALLLAFLYGALAGMNIPVQHALCMVVSFVVAIIMGRRSGAVNNLLLAALAVLLINPLAALGSGFWLSFGAVAALLWLVRWQRGLGRVQRLLLTHGFMSLIMLPLGALFFGGGSVAAMPANLVMIPLLGWLVVPAALLAAVSFFAGWPIELLLWKVAAWPLEYLLPVARDLAEAGGDWLYVPLAGGGTAVFLGIVAVSLSLVPGRAPLKLLAVLLLAPLLQPLDGAPRRPSLTTSVTVLDVGQGTAVVVQSGDRTLLYDTGGGDPEGLNAGTSAILPFLTQRGVRALDTLVISHPDLDHSAGFAAVRQALPVARFRYGGDLPNAGSGRPCRAGEAWRWPGGQLFQFLSPAVETPLRSNDSSCVLLLEIGDYRLLLPGDIAEKREHALARFWGDRLQTDWLLVGHHGSRTSSVEGFLKRVRPEHSVISSGYANRFGHPHPDVVTRLSRQGSTMHNTATDGALEFTLTPGDAVRVSAHRQVLRRYWM